MRFLHLADIHLGKQLNGFSLLEDQRFMLERMVELIAQRKVDALLLAGDLYDRTAPSADAVALLDDFLTAVAATGAQVIAIPGNHDSAERVAYASRLLSRSGIHIAPAYEGVIRPVELEDEHGAVRFWPIPFLKPVHVRAFFPDAKIGSSYTEALRCVVDACAIDPTVRNVALVHQFLVNRGQEPERSDSELSIGGLDDVDASVLEEFDYVAAGHIHKPQKIGREEARYAGSPLKYSFSEALHRKTAPLVTLEAKGSVEIELLPIPALHDLRRIKGPLDELTSPEVVQSADAHDYIEATITDEHRPIDALSHLRASYPNLMELRHEPASAKMPSGSAGSVAPAQDGLDLDPFALFETFYEQQAKATLDDSQKELARHALDDALRQKEGVR